MDVVICPGVEGDNLAARALREFRAATGWAGPPIALEIVKRIPVAAGMAGGSADAAAALKLISELSRLPVPDVLMARLGADVPVMFHGQRALMTGVCEHVDPLAGEKPPLIVIPLDAGSPRLLTLTDSGAAFAANTGHAKESVYWVDLHDSSVRRIARVAGQVADLAANGEWLVPALGAWRPPVRSRRRFAGRV